MSRPFVTPSYIFTLCLGLACGVLALVGLITDIVLTARGSIERNLPIWLLVIISAAFLAAVLYVADCLWGALTNKGIVLAVTKNAGLRVAIWLIILVGLPIVAMIVVLLRQG